MSTEAVSRWKLPKSEGAAKTAPAPGVIEVRLDTREPLSAAAVTKVAEMHEYLARFSWELAAVIAGPPR